MSQPPNASNGVRVGLRSRTPRHISDAPVAEINSAESEEQESLDELASSESDKPSAKAAWQAQNGPWTGWAEIENDPMIFSTLLDEWGVKAVQVSEVVPLDALFDLAPQSVYGLIFLSRWRSDVEDVTSKQPSTSLWFANQISTFSCATVALMNIINNHPDIDLGPQLEEFRNTTRTGSPLHRGLALDKFHHVREVHNSFSTEIDKLCVDRRVKEDMQAAKKPIPRSRKKKRGRKRKIKPESDDEEQDVDIDDNDEDVNGFHFVAYVPVGENVWRMDGMERQPFRIAKLKSGDIWTALVLEDLQRQMESASANQLEFSLLSVGIGNETTRNVAERADMDRAREDWGPFISHMIKLHAEKGDLAEMFDHK